MTLAAAFVVLALSRAEIIERFKTPPITTVDGLVQVYADCPADMREEFHMPVSEFVSNICRELYAVPGTRKRSFHSPGIVVHVGDSRTNDSAVVARRILRDDGSRFTRITLPAPGYSDIGRMRLETVKAFYFALAGEKLDDEAATRRLRATDPVLRAEDKYAEIEKIERGEAVADDDEYLKMCRTVIMPGRASESDVRRFASRLYLYPEIYSAPFCGKYDSCSFADAIDMAAADPRIRFYALKRSSEILVLGGGRGEALSEAAKSYSRFLLELAAYKKTPDELRNILEEADGRLAEALAEAAGKGVPARAVSPPAPSEPSAK